MSELHKFLFDGMPVRGVLVRLDDAWQEVLSRREANSATGAYPPPVRELLGEMLAAGALMQANIKFNGALVLQVFGDGPVKLAVADVQADLSLRATAKVVGDIRSDAHLSDLVNVRGKGRCSITLDPKEKLPGQQAYQGVVSLARRAFGTGKDRIEQLSEVLEHYMLQSEQLDTKLILAADDKVAAGLLIQRLPSGGEGNLPERANEDEIGLNEDYNRISILAASLKREELLELDVDTILRRLFWEEKVLRFEPQTPRFACTCSRQRVTGMIRGLGHEEAESIVAERGEIEVSCDFCGKQYRFDAVDAARIFAPPGDQPPVSAAVQ
jgi:molecular chaperone Hsp33